MDTADQPILRDIVLLGGGHSHVVLLRRFGMKPLPGVRLTLICRDTHTPYSGMLPGYIAGHYGYDEIHIDLRRLAEFAGARFYHDEAVGLDRAARHVLCSARPPVAYDRLSINIGATPRLSVPGAEHAVPVKPINRLNDRWLALLERVRSRPGPMRLAVVGAGAAGVELTLALQHRLRNELRSLGRDPDELEFHLLCADAQILPTHNAWVRRRFAQLLQQRGAVVHTRAQVSAVEPGRLHTHGAGSLEASEIIWATDAAGAPWLAKTGLELDGRGFIKVSQTLQSVTDPDIFAAGDIASMVDHPREKAGVFAVRQGRPLAENLRRSVQGRPLRRYRPQRRWLALISTGDRAAVASRGEIGFAGAWVWYLKDRIDRRFMTRFSELTAMSARPPPVELALSEPERREAEAAVGMRCAGCGAKVAADPLAGALARLRPPGREDVLVGLDAPDDAAVIRVPSGKTLVQSVDFFRAFVSDPYLFGRIAANHALSDIFAMGAQAQTAMAMVTVPPGLQAKVADTVYQLMAGALASLEQDGCALVGGHTGEGRELSLGFAVTGLADEAALLRKSGLRAGDALLLGKPLGTGVLLAAQARLQARGRWIDAALASMSQSSRRAMECLLAHEARACTDVSGFGLAGHLFEMLRASTVDAQLSLAALPVLEGAEACSEAGILGELQRANLRSGEAVVEARERGPRYPLLFDPQTAGCLLAAVPTARAAACLQALRQLGYAGAAIIGTVRERAGDGPRIVVEA
jgi:selenide, water dikinase